jgi:TPP-dependent pyruvate/acetoin dehydrogenase alpha subunit
MIEAVTYRWFGHYAGDRAAYRVEEEVREWRERDPLIRARAAIGDATADTIDGEVEQVIEAALEFAQQSPITEADAMYLDHYAQP